MAIFNTTLIDIYLTKQTLSKDSSTESSTQSPHHHPPTSLPSYTTSAQDISSTRPSHHPLQTHHLQTPHPTMATCATCNKAAKQKCAGCKAAPKYTSTTNDNTNTVPPYCNQACQKTHWTLYKAAYYIKQRRVKLARVAALLKATLIAYRECAFDVDIWSIEFRDGGLWLQQGPGAGFS